MWILVGTVAILVLVFDVFITVFSPHGVGGPVNRRQNRLIWRFFRATGRRGDGSVRDQWLAMGGPVLVVVTLTVWMLWLVAGFTLLYLPHIENFRITPGSMRSPFLEALYFSGYTASTLGLGDVVPDTTVLRLLAVTEAFGGFALLSASITYFLAVYRELISNQAVASAIAAFMGRVRPEEWGRGMEEEIGLEPHARWSEDTAQALAPVLMAHFHYPVLHYFRNPRPPRALPLQLGHLLRLRRSIREAGDGDPLSAFARHPSYRYLEATVEDYVHEVEELFVPSRVQLDGAPPDDPVELAHRRTLAYMLYA